MKKSHTTLLLLGGAVALYLYSQSQAQASQGGQGQGQLPSGGGYGAYGQQGTSGVGATRPRFRY